MPQAVLSSPASLPLSNADLDQTGGEDPLNNLIGEIEGARVLIVGGGGASLLCRMIRRGCMTATLLQTTERLDYAAYDLVIAPRVICAGEVDGLARQAQRALVPMGRFVARVSEAAAGTIAASLICALKHNGFIVGDVAMWADQIYLIAERPRCDAEFHA